MMKPELCYKCGLVGHISANCNKDGPNLYGDWIRAEKHYRNPYTPISQHEVNVSAPNNSISGTSLPPSGNLEAPVQTIDDPNIILANFKTVREQGQLPAIPIEKNLSGEPLFGSYQNALVQFNPAPPAPLASEVRAAPKNSSMMPAQASDPPSILGALPLPQPLVSSKAAPLPPLPPKQSNKGPTYFNPTVPNSDMFSPKANRCLFKSDLVHSSLSDVPKAASVSPPDLSPISTVIPYVSPSNKPLAGAEITQISVDKKGKAKVKRTPSASTSNIRESPKPKRGRPSGGIIKNA